MLSEYIRFESLAGFAFHCWKDWGIERKKILPLYFNKDFMLGEAEIIYNSQSHTILILG